MKFLLSFYLDVPGDMAELVRISMLEDMEIAGKSEYRGNNKVLARIEVSCKNISTCVATIDDWLRCLGVIGRISEIFLIKMSKQEESK